MRVTINNDTAFAIITEWLQNRFPDEVVAEYFEEFTEFSGGGDLFAAFDLKLDKGKKK